jgi:hypothetical protein
MKNIKSQRGFILIVALIACMILAALGVLVVSLSTGDQKTSSATLGEKRALAAVESGFHITTRVFDASIPAPYGLALNVWQNVDSVNAPGAQYNIASVAHSKYPDVVLNLNGFDYILPRYDIIIRGRDTTYNSKIEVDVGIGFRPMYGGTTGN